MVCVPCLQNYLKEVLGFLQLQFSDVEAEKDFAFSNRRPGHLHNLTSASYDTVLFGWMLPSPYLSAFVSPSSVLSFSPSILPLSPFFPPSSPSPFTGYPLSALDSTVQDTLFSAVGACPSLAQEGMFRHCIDCLLGEVRAELPTYGTRVVLQALAECNPTVCSEATERVRQPSHPPPLCLLKSLHVLPSCTSCHM